MTGTARLYTIRRIAYLICGFINKSLSKAESAELHEWVDSSAENSLIFAELLLPYNIKQLRAHRTVTVQYELLPSN